MKSSEIVEERNVAKKIVNSGIRIFMELFVFLLLRYILSIY